MTNLAGLPGDKAATTLQRTLQPGPARNRGLEGEYRRLVYGPGEPRLVRDDLARDSRSWSRELVSLAHIGHLTDMQIADVQSPARFEFFERLRGLQGAGSYVPACRPQEALVAHAVAAMVQTINRLATSPETGASLGLCVSTGDSLDNAQLNELQWFLSLLCGGTIVPNSGGPTYQGVQAADWEPALYWRPERAPDPFKERFGFPVHPGLLAEALQAFRSPGLAMPWLSCFGNHDGLVLGTALPTAAYEQVLRGGHKPADLPLGADPLSGVDAFTEEPAQLLLGPARDVVPDPGRRSIGRRDFVEAHLQAAGSPSGHGFGRWNVESETAYGAYDLDGPVPVRVVLLDTTNMDGYFEGSIGAGQLRWLEARLSEVHSRHVDVDGRVVTTGAADRLVVLASHHGLAAMVNDRQSPKGLEQDHPRVTAGALEALLHRFGNVVLWLNGHRHRNDVQPRPDPSGRTAGFWEVSTSAIADWPCQSRLVELVSTSDKDISVLCTMLDAGVPADPDQAEGPERLAALHRELAANDPFAGGRHMAAGRPGDRNIALLLPAPFLLG
ncbi:MAG TPA: TIGR03767 family metallophosphoesterase [Acidimicrobiales bacterium]|nr:TIGR03767 family metallophosphoesterase [Acidimicrobiales bacterium]